MLFNVIFFLLPLCLSLSLKEFEELEETLNSKVTYIGTFVRLEKPIRVVAESGISFTADRLSFMYPDNMFKIALDDNQVKKLQVKAEKIPLDIEFKAVNGIREIIYKGPLKQLCDEGNFDNSLLVYPFNVCDSTFAHFNTNFTINGGFSNQLSFNLDEKLVEGLVERPISVSYKVDIVQEDDGFSVIFPTLIRDLNLVLYKDGKKIQEYNFNSGETKSKITVKENVPLSKFEFKDKTGFMTSFYVMYGNVNGEIFLGNKDQEYAPTTSYVIGIKNGAKIKYFEDFALFENDIIVPLVEQKVTLSIGSTPICKNFSKRNPCTLPSLDKVVHLNICTSTCVMVYVVPMYQDLFEQKGPSLFISKKIQKYFKNRNFSLEGAKTIVPFEEYLIEDFQVKFKGAFNNPKPFKVATGMRSVLSIPRLFHYSKVKVDWFVKFSDLPDPNKYLVGTPIELKSKCINYSKPLMVDWLLKSAETGKEIKVGSSDLCSEKFVFKVTDEEFNQVGFKYLSSEHFVTLDVANVQAFDPFIDPSRADISSGLFGDELKFYTKSNDPEAKFEGYVKIRDVNIPIHGSSVPIKWGFEEDLVVDKVSIFSNSNRLILDKIFPSFTLLKLDLGVKKDGALVLKDVNHDMNINPNSNNVYEFFVNEIAMLILESPALLIHTGIQNLKLMQSDEITSKEIAGYKSGNSIFVELDSSRPGNFIIYQPLFDEKVSMIAKVSFKPFKYSFDFEHENYFVNEPIKVNINYQRRAFVNPILKVKNWDTFENVLELNDAESHPFFTIQNTGSFFATIDALGVVKSKKFNVLPLEIQDVLIEDKKITWKVDCHGRKEITGTLKSDENNYIINICSQQHETTGNVSKVAFIVFDKEVLNGVQKNGKFHLYMENNDSAKNNNGLVITVIAVSLCLAPLAAYAIHRKRRSVKQ